MAKSIVQHESGRCYLCGANGTADPLHWHHIFGGANRKNSERFGLKVRLCGQKCHENGAHAVHRDRGIDLDIKAAGQRAFEAGVGSREEFMRIFGKNYL